MNLSEWQSRLEKHFAELRLERSKSLGDKPIFALEHGLDAKDLTDLTSKLILEVADSAPSNIHKLPWIIYAAEIGYRYTGDEYWQTFERETPGWTINGNRDWIRNCFHWFHTQFGGAKPGGAWAKHFTIICWPITHAILPRDLQQQLAKTLYESRYSFSQELFRSPSALGERIAGQSYGTSSRFQWLTQDKLLVGQIAAALLLEGKFGTDSLLLPSTLKRIEVDLDRERSARDWLQTARRLADERTEFRGASATPISSTETLATPGERGHREIEALTIEPNLLLHPRDSTCWDVYVEIPDLMPLLRRYPEFKNALTNSRCVVSGADARPRARGFFLNDTRRIRLNRWPRSNEVLLKFEQTNPELDFLLRTDCLLRPTSKWLFRIASDGLGYEIRGLQVRPNGRYVVVDSSGALGEGTPFEPANILCENASGLSVHLPSSIDDQLAKEIRNIGLRQARNVEVWPAGLPALNWDGEGRGEWLASENPRIGIKGDHRISSLQLRLQSSEIDRLQVDDLPPGRPVFVELPRLAPGAHKLRVSVQETQDSDAITGYVDIIIREPHDWTPGSSPRGPFVVVADPIRPTLEELWEGKAAIELRGPANGQVRCTISLFESLSDNPLMVKRLPPLTLPIDATGWREHFETYFRKKLDVENVYDLSRIAVVDFSAEELGTYSINCERQFRAIRWAARYEGRNRTLRLLDDSGSQEDLMVWHLRFETPEDRQRLDPTFFEHTRSLSDEGGMYVAQRGTSVSAVIVSPASTLNSFENLVFRPHLQNGARSPGRALELIRVIRWWMTARLTGQLLSALRRRDVVRALMRHFSSVFAGESWERGEVRFESEGGVLQDLKSEVSTKPGETELIAAIVKRFAELYEAHPTERARTFGSLVMRYLPSSGVRKEVVSVRRDGKFVEIRNSTAEVKTNPGWLPEFALRLASDPQDAAEWAGINLDFGVKEVFNKCPGLMRVARFLVLAIDRHARRNALEFGGRYSGWDWE